MGAASLFFALNPEEARLSDTNSHLVRAYQGLAKDVDRVVSRLKTYANNHAHQPCATFEMARQQNPDQIATDAAHAAWFFYLNRAAFNGLWRVNRKGMFNAPIGDATSKQIMNSERELRLRNCSIRLRKAEISCRDFSHVVETASEGDLVYFDPPYLPRKVEGGDVRKCFEHYTKDGFSFDQHVKLRNIALELKQKGVHVMMTNSDSWATRELYSVSDFALRSLKVRDSVAAKSTSRVVRRDLLIT